MEEKTNVGLREREIEKGVEMERGKEQDQRKEYHFHYRQCLSIHFLRLRFPLGRIAHSKPNGPVFHRYDRPNRSRK